MSQLLLKRRSDTVLTFFVGLGLAILIFISLAAAAFVYFEHENAEHLRIANIKLDNIDATRLPIRSAERHMFGYLLTRDPAYLPEFDKAYAAIEVAGAWLKNNYLEDGQIDTAKRIEEILEKRLALFRFFYETRDKDIPAVMARIQDLKPTSITEFTAFYDGLQTAARKSLTEANERGDKIRNGLFVFLIIGALVSTCIALAVTLVVRQMERGRSSAMEALAAANAKLEETVQARTSELQQTAAEAQRAATTLYNTIQSMADAVIVADSTGTIILSNPKAGVLLSPLEHFATEEWDKYNKTMLPDGVTEAPFSERPLQRALRDNEELDSRRLLLKREGERQLISLQVTTRVVHDRDGKAEGVIAIYRDVTEFEETERQLRYSQKMEAIGQLTGGVAHDFNNILTVILGTIGILRDGVADNSDLAEIARMIDEAAGRGADLTQDLLAFARKQPLQPRPINVPELITSATKLLKPTIGEHIEIVASIDKKIPAALADPSQLTTAILNLAVNARDAMPHGGKIMIETDEVVLEKPLDNPDLVPGRYVMLAVTDNGEGMPPDVRDRIFEPFFTTKPMGRGTGLGLAMVYGFVKQSNGHIQVYSELGYGTSIKLFLPYANEAAETVIESADDTSLPTGNERILVVEDDKLVGDYVTRQLATLGYSTCTADSAAAALKLIDEGEKFDLILTDIILPGGMNGRELAQEVARRRPEMKIVYTSGYSQDAIIHHGRLDSDVLLLSKPYRKAKLAQILRTALDTQISH